MYEYSQYVPTNPPAIEFYLPHSRALRAVAPPLLPGLRGAPWGGLTLVMSGDDDHKNKSHDLLMPVTQSIWSQPVGGSTFAQKNAAFIQPVIQGLFVLPLAAILRDGMLNVGSGRRGGGGGRRGGGGFRGLALWLRARGMPFSRTHAEQPGPTARPSR